MLVKYTGLQGRKSKAKQKQSTSKAKQVSEAIIAIPFRYIVNIAIPYRFHGNVNIAICF